MFVKMNVLKPDDEILIKRYKIKERKIWLKGIMNFQSEFARKSGS